MQDSDQVPTFQRDMRVELDHLMAARRFALVGAQRRLPAPGDETSVVSGCPGLRVMAGDDGYGQRRTRLYFAAGAGEALVLARVRPVPPAAAGHRRRVQVATDGRGRPVPVSCLDPETGVLHLLVRLDDASVLEAAPGTPAAALVIDAVYGRPVEASLAGDGEPVVGRRVPEVVRTLLGRMQNGRRRLVEEEIRVLRSFAGVGDLPSSLERRLEALSAWLKDEGRNAARSATGPDGAEAEVKRVVRMVRSRACGFVRFTGGIHGLVNPRLIAGRVMRGKLFRLQIPQPEHGSSLRLWSPILAGTQGDAPCIGAGENYLGKMQEHHDVYGMVDLVLNYLETNRVDMMAPDGRRCTPSWLEAFSRLF